MMRDKGHKLRHGKFWLDNNKKMCVTRVTKHRKVLPKEVVQFFAGSAQVPNVLSLLIKSGLF